MKKFLPLIGILLTGCVSTPSDQLPITTEKREFLYDYTVVGKSKDELYVKANDFLAISFNNSKVISRVEDRKRGTIISKAIANWTLSTDGLIITGMPCYSSYDIYFIAKDGKARLQLELMEGAPNPSVCGWKLPPKRDYPQIVNLFDSIAKEMGSSLNGNSKLDKLNNF